MATRVRFRSLVHVNWRADLFTAIKIWTADSQILLFSVYIPAVLMHIPAEVSAQLALTAIQNTITTATSRSRMGCKKQLLGMRIF